MHGRELGERVAAAERKADSVISDGDVKTIISGEKPYFNRRGLPVFCGIGYRLGDQAEGLLSEGVRDQWAHVSDLVIDVDPPLIAETIPKIIEPAAEIEIGANT